MATLHLSGIKDAIVSLGGDGDQTPCRLMVPSRFAVQAATLLRSTQISELKQFPNPSVGMGVMRELESHGIQVASFLLGRPDKAAEGLPILALYVLRADEEAAGKLLGQTLRR